MNPRDHNAPEMNQPSLQVIFNYSARNCDIDVSVTVVFFIFISSMIQVYGCCKNQIHFNIFIFNLLLDFRYFKTKSTLFVCWFKMFKLLHFTFTKTAKYLSFVEHKINGISIIIIDCIRVDTF